MEKGLATIDILSRVFTHISSLEMPPNARVYLLTELAEIEYVFPCFFFMLCRVFLIPLAPISRYHLSVGTSEKIQLSALVGAFKNAVDLTAASAALS